MSTPPTDPYKVLGVPMDAQVADIRTAHRKLILKCHPDKVADPALKAQKQDEFQKVQQAYEILSDENERQRCDDMLKLYQLRERMSHNKANSSAPRSSPSAYREFDVRTAEPPRQKAYRDATPQYASPNVKIFSYTTARASSRDNERGPRYYEDARPSRRGESYSEKPSKRETERESQKDREKREEKERRKEKDRKKAEKERMREEDARAEKAARREARRMREKQDTKDKKREKDEKRRDRDGASPYIEPSDDEILHKKSSSRKYDTRERSSGRDEPPPQVHRSYTDGPQVSSAKINSARAYINRSQTGGPPARSNSYHPRDPQPPAAPTPPPAPSAAFGAPEEEDVHRSSAGTRARRGSSDIPPPMPRERNIHRSSREPVQEDPVIVDASPASARARYAPMSESPPRMARTNTMPATEKPSRGPMPPRRSQTYSEGPEVAKSRGRERSKMYAQAEVLSEDEEDYDAPPRRSKHRSRKERSPARAQEIRYHVGGDNRTKLHTQASYTRTLPREQPTYTQYDYDYEPARSTHPTRPEYARGASYAGYKVKQAQHYGADDIAYSTYEAAPHPHYPRAGDVGA